MHDLRLFRGTLAGQNLLGLSEQFVGGLAVEAVDVTMSPTGFRNGNHLTVVFGKVTGQTPTSFRRAYQMG